MKDIRTLCGRCVSDMELAGYKLVRTNKKTKEECDKCNRMGWDYEVQRAPVLFNGTLEKKKIRDTGKG